MDPLSITSSFLAIWFMQNLSVASQEAVKEIGKSAGKGIVTAAHGLVETIRKKLSQAPDQQSSQIARQIEQGNPVQEGQLTLVIDQLVQTDLEFSRTLRNQVQAVRNALLNTLDERFTARDLNEVFFRLGLDADKTAGIGVPHKTKAEELIKYIETRRQLPDLLQTMVEVNPTILEAR
jgi:hypothetical protein